VMNNNKKRWLLVFLIVLSVNSVLALDLAVSCTPTTTVGAKVSCDVSFSSEQATFSHFEGKLVIPTNLKYDSISASDGTNFDADYYSPDKIVIDHKKSGDEKLTKIFTVVFTALEGIGKLGINFNADDVYNSKLENIVLAKSSYESGAITITKAAVVGGSLPTGFCTDPKKTIDKGTINLIEASQYCDSSYKLITCGKEKKEGEWITVDKKQYVCDTGKFTECFNVFCPLTKDFAAAAVVNGVLPVAGFGALTNNNVGATDFTTAVDVASNTPFYTLFTADDQEVYFKYNGKIYVVSVYDVDQYKGTATVDVQSYVDDTFVVIDQPIELLLTSKNKLVFEEKQAGLNLEGDSAVDAYLGVYGYFQNDATKKLQLLITVNPQLNLDKFSEGTLLLPVKNTQKFQLNGEHSVLLSKTKTGPILSLGGEQYTDIGAIAEDMSVSGKEVLLDFGQKVSYQIVDSSLPIGVVKLSKGEGVLSTQYERFFTKDIKYDVSAETSYQICKSDAAVLNVVSVCDQTQKEKFSLSYETKVKEESGILYWYVQSNQSAVKKVQVFQLRDLTALKNEKATPFTQNMVLGKRLALKVDGKYYVLSHPVTQYMELSLLQLTSIEDGSVYIAEGNQEEVWFNLPLAKQVNVKLNLGKELSYDLSAKIKVSKDVNLVNELQTKVSTYGTTKLKVPDLGEMGIHKEDIKTLKDKMRITYTQDKKVENKELSLNVPAKVVVLEDSYDILVYYNKFTSGGADKFTKYADVYLLYDLGYKFEISHVFTDENFVYPLVKGGKIAFLYDQQYYLLGYGEQWDPKGVGFSIGKLQLTSMDGVTKYTQQSTPKGIVFDVGGKKIEIWYDSIKKLIYFKGATSAIYAENSVDLDTVFSVKLPDSSLTQKNVLAVTFGSTAAGTYHNCDNPSYKGLKGTFLLCGLVDGDETKATPIALNEPMLVDSKILVWYRAKTGEKKDVTLQKVYDLTVGGDYDFNKFTDWVGLKESLQAQKYPVLKDKDNYYELIGKGELSTFGLKKIPMGEISQIKMGSTEEGTQSGTIVIGNNLYLFKQSFEDNDIVLQMGKLYTKLLTKEMVNVTAGSSMSFVNGLDEIKYYLEVQKVGTTGKLVKIIVSEDQIDAKPFASFKLANEASKKVVLPNGKVIKVEVLDVTKGIVGVSQ